MAYMSYVGPWRCTMSALSISWHAHISRSISCNETHQVTFEIYHFFCVRKMKRPMMVWKLNLEYLYANISPPLLPPKKKSLWIMLRCWVHMLVLVAGNIKRLIFDIRVCPFLSFPDTRYIKCLLTVMHLPPTASTHRTRKFKKINIMWGDVLLLISKNRKKAESNHPTVWLISFTQCCVFLSLAEVWGA